MGRETEDRALGTADRSDILSSFYAVVSKGRT